MVGQRFRQQIRVVQRAVQVAALFVRHGAAHDKLPATCTRLRSSSRSLEMKRAVLVDFRPQVLMWRSGRSNRLVVRTMPT